jgi:hypothetical protein
MSDQLQAETTNNIHERQTSMPPAGFEPTIPASDRPQSRALDRATIGIGSVENSGLYLAQICPGIRITEGLLYL